MFIPSLIGSLTEQHCS